MSRVSMWSVLYLLKIVMDEYTLYDVSTLYDLILEHFDGLSKPALKNHLNRLSNNGLIVKVYIRGKKTRKVLGNVSRVLWGLPCVVDSFDEFVVKPISGRSKFEVSVR